MDIYEDYIGPKVTIYFINSKNSNGSDGVILAHQGNALLVKFNVLSKARLVMMSAIQTIAFYDEEVEE
ncbi:hypothetical protein K0B03_00385 [Patescibacteria group bacterium]|nr:hypothetical protein [Patescibacteria group bacterium]